MSVRWLWVMGNKKFAKIICALFEKPEYLLQFSMYITKQHSHARFFTEAENNQVLLSKVFRSNRKFVTSDKLVLPVSF